MQLGSITIRTVLSGRAAPASVAIALALTALLAAPHGSTAGSGAGRTRPAPAREPVPFARVYLALRGCTSCSHCRTTIRQMVGAKVEGGQAAISDDRVEVTYATPRHVPLKSVITTLAKNRLHDLALVDVLFEAEGRLVTADDGSARFELRKTGQSLPVSIDRAVARPADGKTVRLIAMVSGWREEGAIALVAREFKPNGRS